MNKFIATTAAFVALSGVALADDADVFLKEAVHPVVQLERNCSGSVVNTSSKEATYILTANHCFELGLKQKSGHVNIDIKADDSSKVIETNTYVYDIVVRNVNTDLAVLKLRAKNLNLEGVTIATENPKEGETVWTIGYSLGLERMTTEGHFGGLSSIDLDEGAFDVYGNSMEVYRASPAIIGGNSGGAMFIKRDSHYEQVGVTYAGFPQYFVYGLYHTQKQIKEILEDAMRKEANTDVPTVVTGGSKKND